MRGVIVAGIANTHESDYLFTHLIVRIRSMGPRTCMVVMMDGSKYTFGKPARELVELIMDEQNSIDQALMDALPGTDVVQ